MKPSLLFSVLVLALVITTQTFAQAPRAAASQDVRVEFEQMKRDLTRLNQEVAALKAVKAPKPEEFQEVVAYIQTQAAASSELKRVLAESEEKGFTYGINPDSRIVLLAGFEKFATALESSVPGTVTEE